MNKCFVDLRAPLSAVVCSQSLFIIKKYVQEENFMQKKKDEIIHVRHK